MVELVLEVPIIDNRQMVIPLFQGEVTCHSHVAFWCTFGKTLAKFRTSIRPEISSFELYGVGAYLHFNVVNKVEVPQLIPSCTGKVNVTRAACCN